MTGCTTAALLASCFVSLSAADGWARSQESQLPGVKPGQSVVVEDVRGSSISGRVAKVTASSLIVLAPDAVTIPLDSVSTIQAGDSIWNGLLIGAGVGGALAVLGLQTESDAIYFHAYIGAWLYPTTGAVVGALVDRARRKTIFRRSSRSDRLVVSPWIAGGARGISVVVTF